MSSTLESSVFMVKNCPDKLHSIKNTKDLTMKHMFDISAKLVTEQDEIFGVKTMEFEWNIFPGLNTLQLNQEVQDLLLRLGETPENFTGRIIFMSMFNDVSWRSKDNKKECESNASLVSHFARRFGAGQWSFIFPGSEKKWYPVSEDSPQGEWDKMAEKMMLTSAESGHPVFRAHESIVQRSAQKPRRWKIVDPLLCRSGNDSNCFSHNCFCKSAQSLRSSRRNV